MAASNVPVTMPKKVDPESRRAAIAESVWRLIARGGIDVVTLRNVAFEAGISLGQIQHYFTGKFELLSYAHQHLTDRVTARLTTHDHPNTDEEPDPRTLLRDALVQLLPLDDDRTLEAHAGHGFLTRATVSPEIAVQLGKAHADREDFIVDHLRRGQRLGTVALDLDPTRAARILLAVIDGLTAHVLIGHHSPADAEHALDTHLDELFTH